MIRESNQNIRLHCHVSLINKGHFYKLIPELVTELNDTFSMKASNELFWEEKQQVSN